MVQADSYTDSLQEPDIEPMICWCRALQAPKKKIYLQKVVKDGKGELIL